MIGILAVFYFCGACGFYVIARMRKERRCLVPAIIWGFILALELGAWAATRPITGIDHEAR